MKGLCFNAQAFQTLDFYLKVCYIIIATQVLCPKKEYGLFNLIRISLFFYYDIHILNLAKTQIPFMWMSLTVPHINLCSDSRSLRFSCAYFGWRTFYFSQILFYGGKL